MRHLIYNYENVGLDQLKPYKAYYNDETNSIETLNEQGERFRFPRDFTLDEVVGKVSDFKYCVPGPGGHEVLGEPNTQVTYVGIKEPPFWQKEYILNSPFCTPHTCDVTIRTPITTYAVTEFDSLDGRAVVEARSSRGGVKYSIDNTLWQESGIFEKLGAGTYTVYATDERECKTQASFTIEGPEPYNLRYHFFYFDKYGVFSEVKLYKRGYLGAPETLETMGKSPFVLSYGAGSDGIHGPIVATEARLAFRSNRNFKFTELFTSDNREIKVEHIKEGKVIWRGFLYADRYGEDYTQTPYGVFVSASDNLASLQKEPFQQPGGEPYTGKMSAMQVITICLKRLYLDLPIFTSINTYEEYMLVGPEYDPLTQQFIDVEIFYKSENGLSSPMSCYEVLDKILTSIRAILFQDKDGWEIREWDLREVPTIWIGINPICEDDGQLEQRPKLWIGINPVCEQGANNPDLPGETMNTGKLIFTHLREVYADTQEPTGTQDKPNDPFDTDYIPGVQNFEMCPVPAKCSLIGLTWEGPTIDINNYTYITLRAQQDPTAAIDNHLEYSLDGVNWQRGDMAETTMRVFSVVPGRTYKGRARQWLKPQCIAYTEDFTIPLTQQAKINFDKVASATRLEQIQTLILGPNSFGIPIIEQPLENIEARLNIDAVFRAYPRLTYNYPNNDRSQPPVIAGGWQGVSTSTPVTMEVTNTRTGEVLRSTGNRFDAILEIRTVPTSTDDNYLVKIV